MNQAPTAIAIDGRALAREVITRVARVTRAKQRPHLAIVQIGENPESKSYIKQKRLAARRAKVAVSLHQFKHTPSYQDFAQKILSLDQDPNIHGVIIQRPLPPTISSIAANRRVSLAKDVDGFLEKSPFYPPVACAVLRILNDIYFTHIVRAKKPRNLLTREFIAWVKDCQTVLIGRGETGGKPIASALRQHRIRFIMSHSRTENIAEFTAAADIIISAVGKPNVVTPAMIKQGAILIGVGIRKEKKSLAGDYDEAAIATKAAFYTPTPGGMGPLTVACLLHNVAQAYVASRAKAKSS